MARTIASAAPGRVNRRFFIVALLLAVLSAVLVYAKISSGGTDGDGGAAPGDQQVVVAKSAIKQRTTITAEMLEVKSLPLNAVIVGSFSTIDDTVGKVTKLPIEANQQVVASSVVDPENPAAGEQLSLVVPTGRRAIAIQASQVIGAGGLVLPGDYVDVIWVCCEESAIISKTILRNVQVAAVAQTVISSGPVSTAPGEDPVAAEEAEPNAEAVTLTLLLTPAEAQTVFLAEEAGVLRADLRNVSDQEQVDPGFALITDLLPVDVVARLLEGLRPEGYQTQ